MPNIKLRKLRKTPLFSPILGPVDIKTVNNFFFTSSGMYDRKKRTYFLHTEFTTLLQILFHSKMCLTM